MHRLINLQHIYLFLQNMTMSDSSDCLLPDDYQDWLTFSSEGSSVTFEIPQVNGRNLKKMIEVNKK